MEIIGTRCGSSSTTVQLAFIPLPELKSLEKTRHDSLDLSCASTSCLEAWIRFAARAAVKIWAVLSSQEKAGWNSSTWWEMLCQAQGGGQSLTPVPALPWGTCWGFTAGLGAAFRARVQMLVLLPSLKPWGAPRADGPPWALVSLSSNCPLHMAEIPPSLPVWVFVTPQVLWAATT